jgi:hypothetical protein
MYYIPLTGLGLYPQLFSTKGLVLETLSLTVLLRNYTMGQEYTIHKEDVHGSDR